MASNTPLRSNSFGALALAPASLGEYSTAQCEWVSRLRFTEGTSDKVYIIAGFSQVIDRLVGSSNLYAELAFWGRASSYFAGNGAGSLQWQVKHAAVFTSTSPSREAVDILEDKVRKGYRALPLAGASSRCTHGDLARLWWEEQVAKCPILMRAARDFRDRQGQRRVAAAAAVEAGVPIYGTVNTRAAPQVSRELGKAEPPRSLVISLDV